MIIKQQKNIGLADSVIWGVTEVVNRHGKVIVVEDDLTVKPGFLSYMNEALHFYEQYSEFGSVSGFTYPIKELKTYEKKIFVTFKAECWGWGTWSDRWNNAVWRQTDFKGYLSNHRLRRKFETLEAGLDRLMVLQSQGRISSWAVRWIYYLFSENKYTVYPRESLVINEGFDGSGTHRDVFDSDINDRSSRGDVADIEWSRITPNPKLADAYGKFPRKPFPFYLIERVRYYLITSPPREKSDA